MSCYAEVAITCRHLRHASPRLDRLAPFAGQLLTSGVTAWAPVGLALGRLASVLDRYDEAEAYFVESAAFNGRADAAFFAAATNLAWGETLAERQAGVGWQPEAGCIVGGITLRFGTEYAEPRTEPCWHRPAP